MKSYKLLSQKRQKKKWETKNRNEIKVQQIENSDKYARYSSNYTKNHFEWQ